jgi:hypothetical protein
MADDRCGDEAQTDLVVADDLHFADRQIYDRRAVARVAALAGRGE